MNLWWWWFLVHPLSLSRLLVPHYYTRKIISSRKQSLPSMETCVLAFYFENSGHVEVGDSFLFKNEPNFTAHRRHSCSFADDSGSNRALHVSIVCSQSVQEPSPNDSCSAMWRLLRVADGFGIEAANTGLMREITSDVCSNFLQGVHRRQPLLVSVRKLSLLGAVKWFGTKNVSREI